jgi:hypothetical protein
LLSIIQVASALRRRCLALAANVIAVFAAQDVVTLNAKICPGAQAVATKMSEGNERRLRRVDRSDRDYFIFEISDAANPGVGCTTITEARSIAHRYRPD